MEEFPSPASKQMKLKSAKTTPKNSLKAECAEEDERRWLHAKCNVESYKKIIGNIEFNNQENFLDDQFHAIDDIKRVDSFLKYLGKMTASDISAIRSKCRTAKESNLLNVAVEHYKATYKSHLTWANVIDALIESDNRLTVIKLLANRLLDRLTETEAELPSAGNDEKEPVETDDTSETSSKSSSPKNSLLDPSREGYQQYPLPRPCFGKNQNHTDNFVPSIPFYYGSPACSDSNFFQPPPPLGYYGHQNFPSPQASSFPQMGNNYSIPSPELITSLQSLQSMVNTYSLLIGQLGQGNASGFPAPNMWSSSSHPNPNFQSDSPPLGKNKHSNKENEAVDDCSSGYASGDAYSIPQCGVKEKFAFAVLLTHSADAQGIAETVIRELIKLKIAVFTMAKLDFIKPEYSRTEKIEHAFEKSAFIIPILTPQYVVDIRNTDPETEMQACTRDIYTRYTSSYSNCGCLNKNVRVLRTRDIGFKKLDDLPVCLQSPFELFAEFPKFVNQLTYNFNQRG